MSAGVITCPVAEWAEKCPEGIALVSERHTWTWHDLDEQVEAATAFLRAVAPPGAPFVMHRENSPGSVVLVLAAWRSGHILVPLSHRLPKTQASERADAVRSMVSTALPHRAASTNQRLAIPLDRPATVVFTSGSTGTPKAALHTAGNHVWSARGWIERLGLGPGDRWLLDLPISHVGGLAVAYRCALAGATMVLPPRGMPTTVAIQRFSVTHVSLVATQLYRLLRGEVEMPGSLRLLLLGGSAIPAALLDRAHAHGLPIATSYGLTEMASTVTATMPDALRADLATSGTVLPHRDLAIRGGEIIVRGRTRFSGYLTARGLDTPFDADGWFATGDLGRLDAEGRLVVTGRRDNRFVSGGENIQPEAIERVLLEHEGVRRAVVVPVEDAEYGQRPVAFVQAERALDERVLAEAVRERLGGLFVPVQFFPWSEQEGLKPSRAALSAEAERSIQTKRP